MRRIAPRRAAVSHGRRLEPARRSPAASARRRGRRRRPRPRHAAVARGAPPSTASAWPARLVRSSSSSAALEVEQGRLAGIERLAVAAGGDCACAPPRRIGALPVPGRPRAGSSDVSVRASAAWTPAVRRQLELLDGLGVRVVDDGDAAVVVATDRRQARCRGLRQGARVSGGRPGSAARQQQLAAIGRRAAARTRSARTAPAVSTSRRRTAQDLSNGSESRRPPSPPRSGHELLDQQRDAARAFHDRGDDSAAVGARRLASTSAAISSPLERRRARSARRSASASMLAPSARHGWRAVQLVGLVADDRQSGSRRLTRSSDSRTRASPGPPSGGPRATSSTTPSPAAALERGR